MSAATQEEILTIRNQLIAEHGIEAVELASMLLFFYSMTPPLGFVRDANFTLLSQCVMALCEKRGIKQRALFDAIDAMHRANGTLAYINGLPD